MNWATATLQELYTVTRDDMATPGDVIRANHEIYLRESKRLQNKGNMKKRLQHKIKTKYAG